MKIKLLWMFLVLLTGISALGSEDAIQGLWQLPQDGTLIKIQIENGLAQGFIFQRPHNRFDEIDKFNPDPRVRDRSLIGLKVLSDLKDHNDKHWGGGMIYDPDSGHSYHAQMQLKDTDTLAVRGFILLPLFGRTATLKRYKASEN